MKISFELSDDVVRQLNNIPNLDSFVNKAILNALQNQEMAQDKTSKWGLLAQEIDKNTALNPDGHAEQLKKDNLEIRDSFVLTRT